MGCADNAHRPRAAVRHPRSSAVRLPQEPCQPECTTDEAERSAASKTEMVRQVHLYTHLSGRQSTVASALCVAEDHDADRDDGPGEQPATGSEGSEKLSLLRPNTRKLSVGLQNPSHLAVIVPSLQNNRGRRARLYLKPITYELYPKCNIWPQELRCEPTPGSVTS